MATHVSQHASAFRSRDVPPLAVSAPAAAPQASSGPAIRPPPSLLTAAVPPPGATVQRRLNVAGTDQYREKVRAQLQQLAGAADQVEVRIHPRTGEVALHGQHEAPTPSHTLLKRVIASEQLTSMRPAREGEAIQADPTLRRGWMRTAGDTLTDLVRWRPWGHAARMNARAVARDPQRGSDVSLPYDPLRAEGQLASVEVDKKLTQEPTPAHIVLGHELGHADRFQRGRGAFTAAGEMTQGSINYRRDSGAPEVENHVSREEIENVGLEPADDPAQHFRELPNFVMGPNLDVDGISENDLRNQFGLPRRIRYP